MTRKDTSPMKKRITRRIAIKTLVLGFWAASMIAIMVQQGSDAAGGMLSSMTAAVIAVWAVSTFRDVRRLRNEAYLQQAMIAESDERNILIAYKATRLAAVATGCAAPVGICALSYMGMQEAADAIAAAVGFFAVIYLASWAYFNRTC